MYRRTRYGYKGRKQAFPQNVRRAAQSARLSAARARIMAFNRAGISAGRRRAALAIANSRTAGFLGIETKFFDTAMTVRALTAPTDATGGNCVPTFPAGGVTTLTTPAVGDSEQNRDGKRIIVKNVQMKIYIASDPAELIAGPPANCKVFVALVQDTQTNAAVVLSENIFKNTGAAAVQAASPIRNLLFANRFRVLKSEVVDVTPTTLSHFAVDSFSHSGVSHCLEWFVPLDIPVNFNAGTTADVANVIDNSLYLVAYSNNATTVTSRIVYNARIRFQG